MNTKDMVLLLDVRAAAGGVHDGFNVVAFGLQQRPQASVRRLGLAAVLIVGVKRSTSWRRSASRAGSVQHTGGGAADVGIGPAARSPAASAFGHVLVRDAPANLAGCLILSAGQYEP
jgi:hypothetical protein